MRKSEGKFVCMFPAVAVALANKTARMAWAMLRNETNYDPDFAISRGRIYKEILNDACISKLHNGKQVELASAKPGNVHVREVRQSDWALTRG